jgi:hypothetical protein
MGRAAGLVFQIFRFEVWQFGIFGIVAPCQKENCLRKSLSGL